MKYITSPHHPLVKHLVKLRKDRAYRYEQGTVLIEGRKMVLELIPKRIITTNEYELISAEEVICVPKDIMEKISGMESPEGIVGELDMPTHTWKTVKRLLVLDRINDPGNLGVLLRTALAFGWDGAFLLKGCCDPFNDKAITAARGASFKLPLQQGTWSELKALMETHNLKPYVADIEGIPLNQVSDGRLLLVLGNESQGPSDETLSICQSITIPMTQNMESLNVAIAGGILMHTLGEKL